MAVSDQQNKFTSILDGNAPKDTKSTYIRHLARFYNQSQTIHCLEDLIRCPTQKLQKELEKYCDFLNNRVTKGDLSPNSVGQQFTGIKNALDNNYRENDIKWKPIENKYPPLVRRAGYKPYKNAYIAKMILNAKTARNRAVILVHNSIGNRVGVHDHPLLMKHAIMMSSTFDDHLDCMALLLYADESIDVEEMDIRDEQEDDERDYLEATYWGFLTPEATKALLEYWDERRENGETFTPDSPVFANEGFAKKNRQLSRSSVQKIYERAVVAAKIPRVKKGRRFDIQLTHGGRKKFNTDRKTNSNTNSNMTEKLMAHKKGLDGTYFRPTRFTLFADFVIGIPDLTVDDAARKQLEINLKQKTITELEHTKAALLEMKRKDDERWEKAKKYMESKKDCMP